MKFLEHKIPPPLLVLILSALMKVLSTFESTNSLMFQWRYPLMSIFLIIAFIFGAPAFRSFAHAKTTINPVNIDQASTLVTSGIYRFSRNPMYVSLTSLLLALASFLSTILVFIGPFFFVMFITRFQILPEESLLALKFNGAYAEYKLKVRRWI